MITYLNIENLGIIDKLEIGFDPKLNILTGETGAGKTLIVESLNLLAGSRFSKDMIKRGADYLLVEASIFLKSKILNKAYENMGYEKVDNNSEDIELVISRKADKLGKNICKIDGKLVSVNELKNFVLYIIDIHGQHENQNIMLADTQGQLIDRFAKKDIFKIYQEYIKKYEQRKGIIKLLDKDLKDEMYTKRQIDLLNFQIDEIEEAKLKTNEDEEIDTQFKLLSSSEKISESLVLSKEILADDVLKGLSQIILQLEGISSLDEKYSNYLASIKSAFYELEEVNYDIDDEVDNVVLDDKEIIRIENRLDKINSLKRKYGKTIDDIKTYLSEIKEEHSRLLNFEEEKVKLEAELAELESEMEILAEQMYSIRKKYSEDISNKVTSELHDLEMKSSKFKVQITKTDEFNQYGKDSIKFLIMTNKGSDYLPLEKIASGGEMSRIMLAIKTILSDEDETPILVFDEIDTGISGKTGQEAGEKLKHIAKKHQVLCVTHLATLAAQGDTNYYIFKTDEDEITKTKITKLNEEETIKEIARISSGTITTEALEYARELRRRKSKNE